MMRLGWGAPLIILLAGAAPQTRIQESSPRYELVLPGAYLPHEQAPDVWRRSAGPEAWAGLTFRLHVVVETLIQPAGSPTPEVLQRIAVIPKGSRPLMGRASWKDLDLGVLEYKAVVKDMPVFGLTTAVPLEEHAILLTVEAPEPLEKEVREDFRSILASFQGTSPWLTEAQRQRERHALLIEGAGLGVLGLYLAAWPVFFRGDVLRAHWARTLWLLAAGTVLFVPITLSSDMSIRRLFLSALLPAVLFGLGARRIKLAIDLGD